MPKLDGVRERQHQPIFDTLVRGIGQSSVNNLSQLFGNANVGQRALTNLNTPGVLASGQTYVVKALRACMWFQALDAAGFAAFGDLTTLSANVTATNTRAQDLYSLMAYGSYINFIAGDKPQFFAPLWYLPAGGGVAGGSTVNDRANLGNGVPSQEAIMLLAKDIHVPAGQNIAVTVEFFPFPIAGLGQGGTIGTTLDVLGYLNEFDGAKLMQIYLDGIRTRDVQ